MSGRKGPAPKLASAALAALAVPSATFVQAATAALPAAAFAAVSLAGCSKKMPRTELRLRVTPAPGAAVANEDDTRIAAGVVDLAIGELGIQRREVLPLPNGRLRVVLPESQRARLADVQKRLEDPKLRVTVE